MSSLRKTAMNNAYQIVGHSNHHWKLRENKNAPRPAYDLLVKENGKKRGRVVFTVLLDLCNEEK